LRRASLAYFRNNPKNFPVHDELKAKS
jgi:hypothetical protein